MRRWLALLMVVIACLTSVGPVVAGARACANEGCRTGCRDVSACVGTACLTCAACSPGVTPRPSAPALERPSATIGSCGWRTADEAVEPGEAREPWTPPD